MVGLHGSIAIARLCRRGFAASLVIVYLVCHPLACVAQQSRSTDVAVPLASLAELTTRGTIHRRLPDAASLGIHQIRSFEDTPSYLYLRGEGEPHFTQSSRRGENNATEHAHHVRRILVIPPSVAIIEDRIGASGPSPITWTIRADAITAWEGREVEGYAAGRRFIGERLLPRNATVDATAASEDDATTSITIEHDTTPSGVWIVYVVAFSSGRAPSLPHSDLESDGQTVTLRLSLPDALLGVDREVTLKLPEDLSPAWLGVDYPAPFEQHDIGPIPLPDGIMPLGEAGYRMVQGWDIPYRDLSKGLAPWDAGRAASQLKDAVRDGTISPCRAVELGCGTGSDAIYLAKQRFDVTAVDIAPTALAIAAQKAHEAGVEVRWVRADVLRLPPLGRFDFLFDRGCYHAIRRDYPKEYVETIRQLTRPRARILILAGNANEARSSQNFIGPPRVTESQIRADFREGFRIVSLDETRFDPTPPAEKGPLAWSILLERTSP